MNWYPKDYSKISCQIFKNRKVLNKIVDDKNYELKKEQTNFLKRKKWILKVIPLIMYLLTKINKSQKKD